MVKKKFSKPDMYGEGKENSSKTPTPGFYCNFQLKLLADYSHTCSDKVE